jgi:hypothetical protein
MRKLGRLMRIFWCRLRGGHIYSDSYLSSDMTTLTFTLRNKCLRCGYIWKTVLNREELLSYDGTNNNKRRRG